MSAKKIILIVLYVSWLVIDLTMALADEICCYHGYPIRSQETDEKNNDCSIADTSHVVFKHFFMLM